MKKLITLITVVTIALSSCKKEKALPTVNGTTYYAVVEVNSDPEASTSEAIYKNGTIVLDPSTTSYTSGDVLLVTAKNTSFQRQDVEILLYVNNDFIKGTEKYLESSETLTLTHTF